MAATHSSVQTVELAIQHVFSRQEIPRRLIEQIGGGRWELSTEINYALDSLVLNLHGMFASQNLENIVIKYPRDWWEAVKERFAPAWFVRRYPVCYFERVVKVDALYPRIPLPPERFGSFIRVVTKNTLRPLAEMEF